MMSPSPTMTLHRIAYEALDVCNAVEMASIDAAVARTGLKPEARALDIGCGNASVSIRLAERFSLSVDAVELEPSMADLARSRISASAASNAVALYETRSDTVLAAHPPYDLITALGVTEPVGGVRDPEGMMSGLYAYVAPGGWLLWGDLVWIAEPSGPVRQLFEIANTYADDAGWQAAARGAGFEVVSVEVSSQALWDQYDDMMQDAVAAWLADHADHPNAAAISNRASQLKIMFDFGRGTMSFALYLLRKPI